jgi:hypothetical protein
MPYKSFLLLILSLQYLDLSAQNPMRFYAYWGYNNAAYAPSTIRMQGADYDLTLFNATAHDRQTPFSYRDYIRPDRITIPQTNFKVGYYLKNNWSIAAGVDHMKYVLDQNQMLDISGTISQAGPYKGTYNRTALPMAENFLKYEHTDGLNFLNVELEKYFHLWKYKQLEIQGIASASIGALMPKTNVTFLNYPRNDAFHLAGFGALVSPGIKISYKNIFFRYMAKGGYMHMPDIKLHSSMYYSRAQQNILLLERVGCLGYDINIRSNKKTKKSHLIKPQLN